MINIIGIIPARYQSSRFPGKPLIDINGKTMIRRVYEQVTKAKRINKVIVATDDERIYNHVRSWDGNVKMTASNHQSGTDRIAEVANQLEGVDFVVNIQGDEPFIHPQQIDQLCDFISKSSNFTIATLAKKIADADQLLNPNVVKVVFNQHQKALYFSRLPIPFQQREKKDWLLHADYFKHLGIYAFRWKTLLKITNLPLGKLEKVESLEQLRWLEAGLDIGVAITKMESVSIDTPDDLKKLS